MARASAGHVHLLADLFGCPAERLRGRTQVEAALKDAAHAASATIVDTTFHEFAGGGVTGVIAIKESHLSIHTWPEEGYAAVDVFVCGDSDPHRALAALQRCFRPTRIEVHEKRRGRSGAGDRQALGPMAGPAARVCAPATAAGAASDPRRGRMAVLYALTLTVAACSIVYELLLAQTLSALLGNTVLRYSITIGCYLGALGMGAMVCAHDPIDPGRRLMRTELALSAIGGVAVPLFYFLDVGQRYLYAAAASPVAATNWGPLAFLLATHAVILGIGFLSGLEVPLLLAIGRQRRRDSTNVLLGVDYLGALIGSVLFPIVLLRTFGLIATGFLVAILNAGACALIVLLDPGPRSRTMAGAGVALAALLLLGLSRSDAIEQYFLKKFYFSAQVTSLGGVLAPTSDLPHIERHRSAYQTIDVYRSDFAYQWVYDLASTKMASEPQYPRNVRLYLNRDYQVNSGVDEFYHEWFVHAPIQAVRHPPRRALVLGGGDGLALRELVAYRSLERIVQVELDPEMIRLAREHPLLATMNGAVHAGPRIEIVNDDAFQWLQRHGDTFDAIYVDMPYPRDYNLAQVYSREFYGLVRQHLEEDGFVALDAPDGSCDVDGGLWPIYESTLYAAGFRSVMPVVAQLDLDAPRIAAGVSRLAAVMEATRKTAAGSVALDFDERVDYLRTTITRVMSTTRQEFLVAFPSRMIPNREWAEYQVPLYAFGPEHLPLAFRTDCPDRRDASMVNSIFRPTLPPLSLLSVQFP